MTPSYYAGTFGCECTKAKPSMSSSLVSNEEQGIEQIMKRMPEFSG